MELMLSIAPAYLSLHTNFSLPSCLLTSIVHRCWNLHSFIRTLKTRLFSFIFSYQLTSVLVSNGNFLTAYGTSEITCVTDDDVVAAVAKIT